MMGKGQPKIAKLMQKKDVLPLNELPDGVLSTIVSFLSLKEAVRTSILSKRWRHLWTCHSDLWFDSESILGCTSTSDNLYTVQTISDRQLKIKFVERINQFIHHRCEGSKIDSFIMRFHLGKEFSLDIDQWIMCAATKGVEIIDVDFSDSCSFKVHRTSGPAFERYEFPCWFLAAPETKSSLKHLRLASCNLATLPSSYSFSSLLSIELQDVNINDQQLKNLLLNCSHLEGLSLHLCKDLVDLNISGLNLQLKSLSVRNCFRLRMIDIYAKNLTMFEYVGQLMSFYFRDVPLLAGVFLNFTGESSLSGVIYALERFSADLPQLETLNLVSVAPMKMVKLSSNVRIFTNIKRLVLTVFPFDDEDELCWMSYVLNAFPRLKALELNLFSPSFLKKPKKIERVIPECCHKQLTELEINGFYGNQHEADLLKFLLDNLAALKTLLVSSSQKLYKGFNDWDCEEAGSWYKSRLGSISKWLHATVPPNVDFYFQ